MWQAERMNMRVGLRVDGFGITQFQRDDPTLRRRYREKTKSIRLGSTEPG